MVARKEGSTRSFPQYNIMKTELASFHDSLSLMSFDGGNRSSTEAIQIAVDARESDKWPKYMQQESPVLEMGRILKNNISAVIYLLLIK